MSGMKASLAEMMNSGKLATIRSGNPVTVSDDAVKSLRKELESELAAMNTNMQSMQDAMVDLVMK
jgi:Skp family chaperone for outer membrane proteins